MVKYSVESLADGFDVDASVADELKNLFSRLMVVATYPPSVIAEEGGEWQFVSDDEVVLKREKADEQSLSSIEEDL